MSDRKEDRPKREETRDKAAVIWHLNGDALRPKEAPFGFIGQNPFMVIVPPEKGRIIKTGISANVPLMVFPTRMHMDDVRPEKEGQQWPIVFNPGEEINVLVLNTSKHSPMAIEDKEGVVYIYPLVFSGTTDVA